MNRERLIRAITECGGTVTEQMPLAVATTLRIGGPVSLCADIPPTEAARVVRYLKEEECPYLWIGRGSNLLVSDRGIEGAVLRLSDTNAIESDATTVRVGAGVPLTALCRTLRERGLAGLEFAFGIPGTVGGGVYMNAGAYGGELKDRLAFARVLAADGTIEEQDVATLGLGYRHSALMESGGTVLEATFVLQRDDPAAIGARMEEYMTKRRDKQPLEYPSAGSFFKRPEGHFAGALIQQCGLKGYRVGDAQISEKHAGFVINRGHATCGEVRALAREVRHRVQSETGVTLCPEVRLIGERWPWEE